jgi:voltage-gated potassium channel
VTAGRHRLRLAAMVTGLIAAYYLLPVFSSTSPGWIVLRAVATALLVGSTLWLVVRTVSHELRVQDVDIRLDHLLLAAVTGVVAFALADFVVARIDETQFVGLRTKTDALYFALTALTTVGFGDVHAQGQLARQLVLVQLVFNVLVLASAARTFSRGLAQRSRVRRDSPESGDAVPPPRPVPDEPRPSGVRRTRGSGRHGGPSPPPREREP